MSNPELHDLIGRRVREARNRLGMSVEDLSAKCAKEGLDLSVGQVYLIETKGKEGRKRRRTTVDELLTLAYVLRVSPLVLLLPESDVEYPITATEIATARVVSEWLLGERLPPLPLWDDEVTLSDDECANARSALARAVSYLPPVQPILREQIDADLRRRFDLLFKVLISGTLGPLPAELTREIMVVLIHGPQDDATIERLIKEVIVEPSLKRMSSGKGGKDGESEDQAD